MASAARPRTRSQTAAQSALLARMKALVAKNKFVDKVTAEMEAYDKAVMDLNPFLPRAKLPLAHKDALFFTPNFNGNYDIVVFASQERVDVFRTMCGNCEGIDRDAPTQIDARNRDLAFEAVPWRTFEDFEGVWYATARAPMDDSDIPTSGGLEGAFLVLLALRDTRYCLLDSCVPCTFTLDEPVTGLRVEMGTCDDMVYSVFFTPTLVFSNWDDETKTLPLYDRRCGQWHRCIDWYHTLEVFHDANLCSRSVPVSIL